MHRQLTSNRILPRLSSVLGNIVCTGATSSAQALNVAYQSIKSTGLAGGLNVIVFFTDGQPNEVVYNNWPIKTQTDTRYDPVNWPATISMGPSGCNSGDVLSGGFTILLQTGTAPGNTGYTGGLYNTSSQVAISSSPGIVTNSGCKNSSIYAREDVAYIPTSDAYGNVTNSGYKGAPATFSSGPYQGQIRVDEQIPAVMAAAFNAADYQAKTDSQRQYLQHDYLYHRAGRCAGHVDRSGLPGTRC